MWTLNGGAGDQNVGKAYLDGVTLVVESPTSATQRVAPEADGSYHFSFVGQDYVWRFSDGQSVVVTEVNTAAEPSAAPSVTCRPTTPEPSESASPSASPSPAASESAVPTTSPQPSASEQPAASPFYCGYPIEGAEYGSYDFGISDVTTVPADEINATLDRQFEILGEEWWNRATGDVLKVTLKTTDQPAHGGLSGAGGTVAGDPSDIVKAGYLDLTGQGAAFARGRADAQVDLTPTHSMHQIQRDVAAAKEQLS